MAQLTEQEEWVLDLTVDLANALGRLPVEHDADMGEFVFHIHGIQDKIMSRPTRRWVNGGIAARPLTRHI